MHFSSSRLSSRQTHLRRGFRVLIRTAALLAALMMACGPRLAAATGDEDEWASPSPRTVPPPSPFQILPLPEGISRQVQALKEQGNKSYRAGKYAEACRLYRQASRLDSNDAALRNDVGICFQKLGRKDSALESTREALRLADRSLRSASDYDWSFPDLRARKTAYFNLDRLGGPMREPKPGQCETWSSLSSCAARYHVCAEAGSRAAPGGTLRWSVLRVGLTRARALFSFDEVEVPSLVPKPEMRDMEEMSIDGMSESRSRWLNRDSSVIIPLGDVLETADPACGKDCGSLERVQSECRILHFDPCAGVVGVACAIQERGGDDVIVIGEFYLIPSQSR
jgi:hypothetical protein